MMRTLGKTAPAFNSWLERYQPNPRASLRLFCFPYAGGSARIYRSWAQRLPLYVEVCAVQLPGRDRRIAEPLYTDVKLLAKTIGEALREFFDKPFAFFGHSMGALLGFELAHYLRAERGLSPQHFFASGRHAPQVENPPPALSRLPREELIKELHELRGTPPDVLDHPDLMELMLPVLRADFALGETYIFPERPLLSCPITVLGGLRDTTPRADLQAWRDVTTGPFSLRMFPGDHFFLHSDELQLLEIIGRISYQICEKP